jgi:hypothetical protein
MPYAAAGKVKDAHDVPLSVDRFDDDDDDAAIHTLPPHGTSMLAPAEVLSAAERFTADHVVPFVDLDALPVVLDPHTITLTPPIVRTFEVTAEPPVIAVPVLTVHALPTDAGATLET